MILKQYFTTFKKLKQWLDTRKDFIQQKTDSTTRFCAKKTASERIQQ